MILEEKEVTSSCGRCYGGPLEEGIVEAQKYREGTPVREGKPVRDGTPVSEGKPVREGKPVTLGITGESNITRAIPREDYWGESLHKSCRVNGKVGGF